MFLDTKFYVFGYEIYFLGTKFYVLGAKFHFLGTKFCFRVSDEILRNANFGANPKTENFVTAPKSKFRHYLKNTKFLLF